jgi:hypothetical protein
VNSQRAFGEISTLWLYIAAGGAMVDGLWVFSMVISRVDLRNTAA